GEARTGDSGLDTAAGVGRLRRHAVPGRPLRRPARGDAEASLAATGGVFAGAGGVLLVVDVLRRGRHRGTHRPRVFADLPWAAAAVAVRLAAAGAAGAGLRRAAHHLDRRFPVLALRSRAGA